MLPRVATSAGKRLISSADVDTRSRMDAMAREDTITSLSVSMAKVRQN